MNHYFNIRYELSRERVHEAIAEQVAAGKPDYICVADGVILNMANRKPDYLKVVNGGMFSICDSSYVPLYRRGAVRYSCGTSRNWVSGECCSSQAWR